MTEDEMVRWHHGLDGHDRPRNCPGVLKSMELQRVGHD